MFNGMRRFGAMAIAAAMIAGACSSAAATPTPTAVPPAATPAPATAAMATDTATPAPATPTAAPTAKCVTGNITAAGSTALQPLVTAVAANYDKACPGATVTVSGGGSGTGLRQVAAGSIQIGDSDVTAESKLSATDAAKLVDHAYVAQGWIEVTNPDVTGVTSLTTQQNIDIWTGKDTNWSQVGGPDLPIILVFRPASSGTRATFKKLVLGGATEATGGQTLTDDSTGTVTTAVGNTKGAVSVIGYAYFIDPTYASLHLNGVALDGVACTVPNMVNGTYKLQAIAHMYTNGTPAAGSLTEAFLQYMAGPEVQGTTIPSLGYMPAAK